MGIPLMFVGYSSPAVTITIQPTNGVDVLIESVNPTTNHDTETTAYIGDTNATDPEAQRIIIKFDLSTIPANATIIAASISMFEIAAGDGAGLGAWNIFCYRLKRDWVEDQATWNEYSTGNAWGTAGADNTTTDREATLSASLSVDGAAANAYLTWTGSKLIQDVQAFVNGSLDNYGWIFIGTDAENLVNTAYNQFRTSDFFSNKPKMSITYQA